MKQSLIKSTGIVVLSTAASRVLGFARDMVIAGLFGATAYMDGFWVAFRIPNLFRRLVAEGSLTISFVPVYTEYLITESEGEALALAQKVLSILLVVLASLIFLGEIFSNEMIGLFGYGFTDVGQINLTVILHRIMFPYLFFVSMVAFAMGYLNSHKIFFAPAFSPAILNIGIICGAFFLSGLFEQPLYGLASGVILGGVLQFAFQIPYLVRSGFRLKLSLDFAHPGVRAIFRMIGPALVGIAIYQVNILTGTILASTLPAGSISYIYYSDRINEFVLGIFIISIGNVILPEMSGLSASSDFEKIGRLYSASLSGSLFFAIPAAIALMIFGLPIISVLFMRGEFSHLDAILTEKALFFASIGIISMSVVRITVPVYYSIKNTGIPATAAFFSFITNISAGFLLMRTGLKHAGLTLAVSIAATVQMIILLMFLRDRIGKFRLKEIIIPATKFFISAAVMAGALFYFKIQIDWLKADFITRLFYLFIAITVSGSLYLLSCYLLKTREVLYFKNAIISRLKNDKSAKLDD